MCNSTAKEYITINMRLSKHCTAIIEGRTAKYNLPQLKEASLRCRILMNNIAIIYVLWKTLKSLANKMTSQVLVVSSLYVLIIHAEEVLIIHAGDAKKC